MATDGQVLVQSQTARRGPLFGKNAIQHIKTIFGLAAAASIGIGIIIWGMKPNFTPIFSQQSDIDALQMTEALQSENIQFQIDSKTGLVMVPEKDIQRARMILSASGIAGGGVGGFEALRQEQPIGTSQFMETARYHHVLETELGRTISAMRNIESARVHLAMPKQTVFVRQRAKTSASVMVRLFPGRSLDAGQVSAIVYLVSSSVPYMEASSVTVVDQWGRMLSSQGDDSEIVATKQQMEYTRKLEQDYINRIETLLTPIVGYGKVKAQVNAELDFSTDESFQETYDPNRTIVRSEQVEETQSQDGANAAGVPGALTNQPPAAAGLQQAEVATATDGPQQSTRSTIRNFEVDKTIRRTRQGKGEILRITAAVVIDNKVQKDKRGKESFTPYTAEEIGRITDLVKKAIGFKEERGDSVEVLNTAFQVPDAIETPPEDPIWKQAWVWSLAKQLAAAAVVLFLIFGIVKPALQSIGKASASEEPDTATKPGPGGQYALGHYAIDNALPAPPQVYGDILNMAKAMAAEDPKRVAKVIKDWVAEDGG